MTGVETSTWVSLPCLGRISSVNETSLVEDDRAARLPVGPEDTFTLTLKPFGVKTVRVLREGGEFLGMGQIQARAIADMQVELSWLSPGSDISHYNIYRDTQEKCEPQLLNLVGQAPAPKFTDRPRLNQGGWIRNTLEPATTYYYRVVPVDRWNNPGAPGTTAKVTTLTSQQKNLPPVKVEALRAILVSPISKDNFVNLLFRTACESDIGGYEVHRSIRSDFVPDATTKVGRVGNDEVIKGSQEYGHTPLDYPVKSFDHAMFRDDAVRPGTTYYYRVCAVDTAGQRGEFSELAHVTTK
jgi:hypothetical protein